jgi:hypothetical protein
MPFCVGSLVEKLKPLKSTTMKVCKVLSLLKFSWIRLINIASFKNLKPIGGVTKYRGGCRILIIPAGYVGCAFWAALFVSMSGSRIGGTIVAAGMSAALLVSLW